MTGIEGSPAPAEAVLLFSAEGYAFSADFSPKGSHFRPPSTDFWLKGLHFWPTFGLRGYLFATLWPLPGPSLGSHKINNALQGFNASIPM